MWRELRPKCGCTLWSFLFPFSFTGLLELYTKSQSKRRGVGGDPLGQHDQWTTCAVPSQASCAVAGLAISY